MGLADGWVGMGGFVCSLFLFSVIQLINTPNANYMADLSHLRSTLVVQKGG